MRYTKLLKYDIQRTRNRYLWVRVKKFLWFWIPYGEQFYLPIENFEFYQCEYIYTLKEGKYE